MEAINIRLAEANELDTLYMMGYSAWSDGAPIPTYLDACRTSEKYKLGKWYLLAEGKDLLSSLIVYSSAFDIPPGYCGIGSIATVADQRNNGHASRLINAVCAQLEEEKVKGVYLHTDIGVSFYERLGFHALSGPKTGCMLRLLSSASIPPTEMPGYF
jgi:ribosomal protein S18 acetylase RimI-like enzyme